MPGRISDTKRQKDDFVFLGDPSHAWVPTPQQVYFFRRLTDKRERFVDRAPQTKRSLEHPAEGNPGPSWCYSRANDSKGGRIRLNTPEACQIDVDLLAEAEKKWWTPAAPLC